MMSEETLTADGLREGRADDSHRGGTGSPGRASLWRRFQRFPGDALRVCRAHLRQLHFVAVLALAAGLLAAVVAPADRVARIALILAVAVAHSVALLMGATAMRGPVRQSFLFSRPASAAALFWGVLLAAMIAALVSGALALLPGYGLTLLRGRALPASAVELWPLIALLPFSFLVLQAVSILREAPALARWVHLPLAAVVGAVLVGVPMQSPREGANNAHGFFTTLVLLAVVVGLGAAVHRRWTRGRLDTRGGHRTFAVTLWTVLGTATAMVLFLNWWTFGARPDQLRAVHVEAGPEKRWLAVAGVDESFGLRGYLRQGYRPWFAFERETRRWHRLDDPPSWLLSAHFQPVAFSVDGGRLYTPSEREHGRGLDRLHLASGQVEELPSPFAGPTPLNWWISPEETHVVFFKEEAMDHAFLHSIHVAVLGSDGPIVGHGIRSLDRATSGVQLGAPWGLDLQWTSPATAEVMLHVNGVSARFAVDLDEPAVSEVALVRVGQDELEPSPWDRPGVVGSYRGAAWKDGEVWAATGHSLRAFEPSEDGAGTSTARTVYSIPEPDASPPPGTATFRPSGSQDPAQPPLVFDWLLLEDRLVTIEVRPGPGRDLGAAVTFLAVHRPSSDDADPSAWTLESRTRLPHPVRFHADLGEARFLLSPIYRGGMGDDEQVLWADLVPGVEPRVGAVGPWLVALGVRTPTRPDQPHTEARVLEPFDRIVEDAAADDGPVLVRVNSREYWWLDGIHRASRLELGGEES